MMMVEEIRLHSAENKISQNNMELLRDLKRAYQKSTECRTELCILITSHSLAKI